MEYYILNKKGNPIKASEKRWLAWIKADHTNRVVGDDTIMKVRVSTVFMNAYTYTNSKGIVFFETMIFGGRHNHYIERYKTREQALRGHQRAVAMVREEHHDL